MDLEFKGMGGNTLNPQPYLQNFWDTLSLATGIPEPKLKGSQAGALSGSELNTSDYFKVISSEQTEVEPVVRSLLNMIFIAGGKQSEADELDFVIEWNPGFELTQQEKAQLEFTIAQTAAVEGQFMTINEVRKRRWNLEPLPDGVGEKLASGSGSMPTESLFTSFLRLNSNSKTRISNLQQLETRR
jgi:hypothetical protein